MAPPSVQSTNQKRGMTTRQIISNRLGFEIEQLNGQPLIEHIEKHREYVGRESHSIMKTLFSHARYAIISGSLIASSTIDIQSMPSNEFLNTAYMKRTTMGPATALYVSIGKVLQPSNSLTHDQVNSIEDGLDTKWQLLASMRQMLGCPFRVDLWLFSERRIGHLEI
ncbi:986_t:CDS:2 [Paraglomus occultum]|uniref:986_t:CDS:1 n=1 Tax=Paraglomus occultum TaxID=144539 RepID=A0A9N9D7Q6_9GLOM|nr:986_t:CDS:2 [Paraglomus occultum]